jgi:hypothetical protein
LYHHRDHAPWNSVATTPSTILVKGSENNSNTTIESGGVNPSTTRQGPLQSFNFFVELICKL